MPLDSAVLHAVVPLFVVFIICQTPTTTAMATTPQVTVVYSGTLSLLSVVTMVPSLMGLPATSGVHDVVLLPPLTPRLSGGVVGLATVLKQEPPSQMPLQVYANYAMGLPQVGFSFRVDPPTILYFYMFGVSCGICFLLSFQVPWWMLYSLMGAQPLGFAPLQPFGAYPWQAYVQPANGHWPTLGMHRVAVPSSAFSRRSLLLLN